MKPILALLFLAAALRLVGVPTAAAATSCTRDSGEAPAALLELYTSEGCSSCPPTDAWIGRLAGSGLAAGRLVILGFHVDYWDGIGWRDRFGSPANSERQRTLARRNGTGLVYTPQVLVNGADFRHRGDDRALARAIDALDRPARATLYVELHPAAPGAVDVDLVVTVHEPHAAGDLDAYLAVYENGLSTDVRAGENRGEHRAHDRVVRRLVGPLKVDARDGLTLRRRIELPPGVRPENAGVAAFVERASRAEVLQATALPWCGS
jgi:hypothetical protein